MGAHVYKLSAFLLLMPCLCWSDLITTATDANVNILSASGSVTTPCVDQNPTFSSCLGFAYLPETSSTVTYNANATASYGVLKAFAQGSTQEILSGPVPQFVNIDAVAYFTDTLTFMGSTTCGGLTCLATGPGTVQVQVVVGGTDQFSPGAISGYCVNAFQGPAVSDAQFACPQPNTSGGLTLSPPIPVVFGQPQTFTVAFVVFGHLNDFSSPNVNFLADFNHTATVAGFVVDESNGNPLTSFSVTSGSGTLYPATTVPEPPGLPVLCVTTLLIAIQVKRSAGRPVS